MSESSPDRDEWQAELLDRFWWGLSATDRSAPPVDLDPSLARTASRLRRVVRTEPAREGFVENLREQLGDAAERPSVQPHGAPASSVRFARIVAGGVLAASLATIALIAGLISDSAGGPSAAAILRAAQATAASPTAAGVQTVEMVVMEWVIRERDVTDPPHDPNVPADRDLRFDVPNEIRIWYQAPDRVRVEIGDVERAANGVEVTTQGGVRLYASAWVWLRNGGDHWVYGVHDQKVLSIDATDSMDELVLGVGRPVSDDIDDLVVLLADIRTLSETLVCYEQPRVIGQELIAERPAHVIDLGPSLCPSNAGDRGVIWIDQETAFVLAEERYSAGGDLTRRVEVTSVQYNVDLQPALFELPSGR